MRTIVIIFTIVFVSCSERKDKDIITINTGEVKLITEKCISKDFAYCSAVIAQFGDSAVFAHAVPEVYEEAAFHLIWQSKIYNKGEVTTPNAIQLILNITDSLGVNRERLSFYVIAGCKEEGLEQIMPSIKHYNLKTVMLKIDNTFQDTEVLRDIFFDPRTKDLQIQKQF